MASHADNSGTYCAGSVMMPDAILTGADREAALRDYRANERGEFCGGGDAELRHDRVRCPGYHS